MRFRYLDHTADAMIEAFGKTLEEAFENAALGMFNILTDIEKVEPKIEFPVEVKADTTEKMLYDFLDELLFLMDTKGVIFSSFKNKRIDDNSLYFIAVGDHAKNYVTHGDIKAPTYNEMKISTKDGRICLRFVVDI